MYKPKLPEKEKGISILKLGMFTCRFIISDEDKPVRYCGEKTSQGSYCKEHYAICYIKPKKSWGGDQDHSI